MRDFAHQCLLGCLFWGVLEITYSQDATTDIDAKYVKRRGSAQGCAFWRL